MVGGSQMDPVLGGIAVQLQQHVKVVSDVGDRLGVLGSVIEFEGPDCGLGLVDILGAIHLPHRRDRTRMR
jgi:hypothetical protein